SEGVFSPDSRRLLTRSSPGEGPGSWKETLRLWDLVTGQPVGPQIETSSVQRVEFHPDGRRLLVLGTGAARLWDLETGKPVGLPMRNGHGQLQTAFSPDGLHLAVCGDANLGRVWDMATGEPLTPALPFSTPSGSPRELTFAADSRQVHVDAMSSR